MGAQGTTMGQATAQDRGADGVERDWDRAMADTQSAPNLVEVSDLQASQLGIGQSVQQGEEADQCFVRVGIGPGPAPEEATLFGEAQSLAGKAPSGQAREPPGRVDQHELILACPSKELARGLQAPTAVGGLCSEECLDVVNRDHGPLLFRPLRGQKAGQVAHDAQVVLDGDVLARTGACSQGSFAGPDEVVGEGTNCGAEAFGDGLDTTVPASSRQASFLVESKSQALS